MAWRCVTADNVWGLESLSPESWEVASEEEWEEIQRGILRAFATGSRFVQQAIGKALDVEPLPSPAREQFRQVERELQPPGKPPTREEELRFQVGARQTDIVRRLEAGEIPQEQAEYEWRTAPESVYGNVQALGLGAGPELRDIRGIGDIGQIGLEAITPLAPPEATAPIARLPAIGPTLERQVAGLTSPLGAFFTGKFPAFTAGMVPGATGLGAVGRATELPGAELAGELIGGMGGGLAAQRALPAIGRAALPAARAGAQRAAPHLRDLALGEAGGLKPRVGPQPVGKEAALARWRAGMDAGKPPPPAEPPPPVGADLLGTPSSIEKWRLIEQAHITGPGAQNSLRWLAERAAETGKPLAGITRTTAGPAAVARLDPARRHAVVWRLVEEIDDSVRGVRMRGMEADYPFVAGRKPGTVQLAGRDAAFSDLAQKPGQFPLSPQQRAWIERGKRIIDEQASAYEVATGKSLRGAIEDYWPRFVTDEKGRTWIRSRLGARQSPARERIYETMQEGINEGVPYATPLESLDLYQRALNKMTRDTLLKQALVEDGVIRPLGAGGVRRGEVQGIAFGPGFTQTAMDYPTLKALQSVLGPGSTVWRQLEMINSVPRLLITGSLDAGQLTIQGAPYFFAHPARWATTVARMLQAMTRSRDFGRFLSKWPAAKKAAQSGVDVGGTEFTEALRITPIGRLPVAGQILRTVGRGFDGFITVGRINIHDALASATAGKEGAEGLLRLGRYANTFLGTPSLKGLGISTTQRQIEGAVVFFAARYTRSGLALPAYMLGKGVPAAHARVAIGKFLLGGLATFYGLGKALGLSDKEVLERMNPQSRGRFLSLPVGKNEVGFGGKFRALFGLMGALTVHDNWKFDTWNEAFLQNPAMRYWRSMSAPITGTFLDFATGEDFLGFPVDLDELMTNPRRLLRYMGDRLLPLNLEALLEAEGGVKEKGIAFGVETFGGRAYPKSPYTNLNELTQELTTGWKGGPYEWGDLTGGQRKRLRDENPQVEEAWQRMKERGLEKEREWAEVTNVLEQMDRDFEVEFAEKLAAPEGLTLREMSDYLENYLHERAVASDARYGETEEPDPRTERQKVVDEYYDLTLPAVATPEEREVYFNRQDEMVEKHAWLLGELHDVQVLKFKEPAVREFAERRWQARQKLKEFYEIPSWGGRTVEEGQEVNELLAEASAMVKNGLAVNQRLAFLQIPRERYSQKAWTLATSPIRERFRSKERANFWKANAEELRMFTDMPVETLEPAGVR